MAFALVALWGLHSEEVDRLLSPCLSVISRYTVDLAPTPSQLSSGLQQK